MQQVILPQAITSLIATDANGKPIVNFTSAMPFIKAVVQYLQDTRQNLNTADFVDLLFASLGITQDDGDLAAALFVALTVDYVKAIDDFAVIYLVITEWLSEQRFDSATFSRYLCIINADYPMQSTLNPKKIAVWRNTSKMGDWDKRQAVSVRKWIGSTLVGLTADQAESLACKIDKFLQGETLNNLDVRHHNSYDFDGWERAYVNNAIRSCMNPLHTSCEVGTERTFTTYCSGYHGLPDNGLSLTVLYQDGKPVARAITFSDGEQDCYIRSYGDDRLHKWLQANGYKQSDFKEGTILYATEALMKPYVDGDEVHYADHYTTSDGKRYWVLYTDGEYNLQTVDAFARPKSTCDCCGGGFADAELGEHQSAVDGAWYTVCDNCYFENRYFVYNGYRHTEPVFFHDGYHPATNDDYVEYDGDYYYVDSLREYDLRLIDGEVYHIDDLYYCEFKCEYFTRDEVYLDGDEISTTQPVYFPYDCVSKSYWDNNVVECACGTLAYDGDTRLFRSPLFGYVFILDDHYYGVAKKNKAGYTVYQYRLYLDDIAEYCDTLDDSDKAEQYLQLCQAYEQMQALIAQELGI